MPSCFWRIYSNSAAFYDRIDGKPDTGCKLRRGFKAGSCECRKEACLPELLQSRAVADLHRRVGM